MCGFVRARACVCMWVCYMIQHEYEALHTYRFTQLTCQQFLCKIVHTVNATWIHKWSTFIRNAKLAHSFHSIFSSSVYNSPTIAPSWFNWRNSLFHQLHSLYSIHTFIPFMYFGVHPLHAFSIAKLYNHSIYKAAILYLILTWYFTHFLNAISL